MKVVLVGLSGDADYARQKIAARFPTALIETAQREELQDGSLVSRLSALRARQPDIFAVATERLAWQRGQDALMLFGALAGAQRTIVLDAFGGWREESRARTLTTAPARLLSDAAASRTAMKLAARELSRLEREVVQPKGALTKPEFQRARKIIYLRTTPGPGTQLGGAASHINGFLKAAELLGVNVSLVSNDEPPRRHQATAAERLRAQRYLPAHPAHLLDDRGLVLPQGSVNVLPDGAGGLRRQRARRHPAPRQRPQPDSRPPPTAQA